MEKKVESLQDKTISGFSWSFLDKVVNIFLQFVVGIILARLITPEEFGIIGVSTIFISILPIFVDGGFSYSLIQKNNCTETDYSSVFYFNLVIAVFLYAFLYLTAPFFADFFKLIELTLVLRVMGLSLIISALGSVQGVILSKKINFKALTKISLFAQVVGATLGIGLAYQGYGVWALVYRTLVVTFLSKALLYFVNDWRPKAIFSFSSIKNLFSFGSKLMASLLLNAAFNNIYYFVIGKFYTPLQLGYFTRAELFSKLPSEGITSIVNKVSFPVLANLQDDLIKLKSGYKKLITLVMFITFIIVFGLAASAKDLIITLIGNDWIPSIYYLQLLCFSAVLYPLHALNLNIMNVKGRSDLFLKTEIIKKVGMIPIILLGIFISIEAMLIGMIFFSTASFFLNAWLGGRLINYAVKEQLTDVTPSIGFGVVIAGLMYGAGLLSSTIASHWILLIQILTGVIFIYILGEVTSYAPYKIFKQIIVSKLLVPLKRANT